METNIVADVSPPIPYLEKFWFSSNEPKCCQPIKLQVPLRCNISRKKGMMKFIFRMQINMEVFYKLILSFWVSVSKFAYLCNISRKAWVMDGGWRWFLPADKRKHFLQFSFTLGVRSQACSKYPKQVSNVFVTSQGNREGWSWSFAYR